MAVEDSLVKSRLKQALKDNYVTKRVYALARARKTTGDRRRQLEARHVFEDRSGGCEVACIVLAGYKPFLYQYVFARLQAFLPRDIDVCIVSSGKYVQELSNLSEERGWSYLAVDENNVCLAQNIALTHYADARLVFKIDEDIFITEGFFEGLMAAREHATESAYVPGVIAPLIPVNGYGYVRLLERYGLTDVYRERFERPRYYAGVTEKVEADVDAARFLWGEGGVFPSIDTLAADARLLPIEERPCPIRFSIGAILFERKLWEEMGYLPVHRGYVGLGVDERHMVAHCAVASKPVMVSENVVVGHFGFGGQTAGMRAFLEAEPEHFALQRV